MNRIQVIIAVGLFLVVGLFGWRTYLEKSSHKNRNDARGLPAEFLMEVKRHKAKTLQSSKTTDEKPKAPEVVKPDAVPSPAPAP
jgi:hypothetical protein